MYLVYLALIAAATLVIGPFVLSFGEWSIHKYVLHRPLWFIRFPHYAHALVHHKRFGGDETYFLENRPVEIIPEDEKKIAMARWACWVVVPLGWLPFVVTASLFALFYWWSAVFTVGGIGLLLSASGFALYEYTHYCMHHPKKRWWMRWRILKAMFDRLDEHHQGHHRDPQTNLNVVMFPFWIWSADRFFGTLRTDHPGLAR